VLPIVTCTDVASKPAKMRTPIIDGLLREGETLNIIGPSKTGKSWFALSLTMAIASGRDWLDRYPVQRGRLLYIDNELHRETFQHRVETVARAMDLKMSDLANFSWLSLRGKLCDLHELNRRLEQIDPATYRLLVLDAWYRFLPPGVDENDNGEVTQLYNTLDAINERLKCAAGCIHHASKGNQSGKVVTDVGSGAGAQSRACDTHLILRAHDEPGCYVLDAACRSFPPIEPIVVRFTFPTWTVEPDLDPALLKPDKPRRPRAEPKDAEPIDPWTPQRFADEFVADEPRTIDEVVTMAINGGLDHRSAVRLSGAAEGAGLIHRWGRGNQKRRLSRLPEPQMELVH
jgi:hypothetical protein